MTPRTPSPASPSPAGGNPQRESPGKGLPPHHSHHRSRCWSRLEESKQRSSKRQQENWLQAAAGPPLACLKMTLRQRFTHCSVSPKPVSTCQLGAHASLPPPPPQFHVLPVRAPLRGAAGTAHGCLCSAAPAAAQLSALHAVSLVTAQTPSPEPRAAGLCVGP